MVNKRPLIFNLNFNFSEHEIETIFFKSEQSRWEGFWGWSWGQNLWNICCSSDKKSTRKTRSGLVAPISKITRLTDRQYGKWQRKWFLVGTVFWWFFHKFNRARFKLAVSQADSAKNSSRSFWTDGLNREKLIYYDQLTEKRHLHPFKRLSSTCKPCSIKYYDKFHEKML